MNIAKLERMIAVHEAGSFRKAAKRFGMSQPALTWSIRQLEESLGVALFERGPSGIRPTPACETLMVRARLIVNEHNRLLAEVAQGSQAQVISLGVHTMLLDGEVARILASIRTEEPQVTIRVVEGRSDDFVTRLRRGDLDLALSFAPATGNDDEEIGFEPLLRQHYAVFARPDHAVFTALAGRGPVPEQPWIEADEPELFSSPEDMAAVQRKLARFGMTQGAIAARSASMQVMRRMIVDGGMLGMAPVSQFSAELQGNVVRKVPGSDIEGPPLGVLWIEGCYETRARRRLKDLLLALESAVLKTPVPS